ncbi:MP domain-containing protein, partial [Cephalotus follicularis]
NQRPVYFDGYPDLTIFLTDKNILETLQINIKLHGYNMLPGSEIIAIIHHVHYKTTNSICPKSLVNLSKGETTMMKCVTNDSNILIPQKIKWSDINIPEDWYIYIFVNVYSCVCAGLFFGDVKMVSWYCSVNMMHWCHGGGPVGG